MYLDVVSKLAQIVFYAGGLVLGALTYRRAKSTILNTVNTEYHKKVIERVSALSDELYREFDSFSDDAWHKHNDTKVVIERLHEGILENKAEILARGELEGGIPVSPLQLRLSNLMRKYKSDPFLPTPIRNKVVALHQKRFEATFDAYMHVLEEYQSKLAQGKYWDTLDTNYGWLHNQINDRLYSSGMGISQVEEAVHDIRLEIQRYFDKFYPVD